MQGKTLLRKNKTSQSKSFKLHSWKTEKSGKCLSNLFRKTISSEKIPNAFLAPFICEVNMTETETLRGKSEIVRHVAQLNTGKDYLSENASEKNHFLFLLLFFVWIYLEDQKSINFNSFHCWAFLCWQTAKSQMNLRSTA